MTAPLSAEDYQHIREDVRAAVLEASREDPPVTMEILFRLLDELGHVATEGRSRITNYFPLCHTRLWAEDVLRDVHLRATSKVPYGEPREPDYLQYDVLDLDERSGR